MPTLTPTQITERRQEVIRQFQEYRVALGEALDEVEDSLERGEFAVASNTMSMISQHQASASIKMRATLIKFGFLSRESTDDN